MLAVQRVVQERDAHFVGGLLAPGGRFRRRVWVARVVRRIVVGRGHLDAGAFREGDGLLVEVGRLPVEVPVGDGNQRHFLAAWQERGQLHGPAQEVHVRRHG